MSPDETLLYLSTRQLAAGSGAGALPVWRRALNVLSWIEPSVGVGPVGGTVKVPRQQVSDWQRVSYFWKRLKKNGKVGTIDDPSDWFEGSHKVRYQEFTETNPRVMWFSGETERTLFHMGGASKHLLIAQAPVAPTATPLSLFEEDIARTVARSRGALPDAKPPGDESQWVRDLQEIWQYSEPSEKLPERECHFLAKTEKFDPERSLYGKAHLLGALLLVTYH